MVTIRDHEFEEYISKEELESSITILADKINSEYKGQKELPVFLISLSGGIFFAIELLKKLNFYPKIGFVKCSSYGNEMTSCGKITLQIEPTIDIYNKEVIVLEDIIDTGLTWKYLFNHLNCLGAKKARIATMLLKKTSIDDPVPVDWCALEVDNKFIIGMGLDYGELGRNLPTLFKLKS